LEGRIVLVTEVFRAYLFWGLGRGALLLSVGIESVVLASVFSEHPHSYAGGNFSFTSMALGIMF
jgi:hypothetical protein